MAETRKLAAILAADVVDFSRLTGADEERTLARLRSLRSDLVDPTIAVHSGRVFKHTGDGVLAEFRSAVEALRCAIELQTNLIERNDGLPPERRIVFRVGIHVGDVVEESDGDLMGEGVNIAARLEGVASPGAICLSEDAYRQVKGRVEIAARDLGAAHLKNIADPIRVYSVEVRERAGGKPNRTPEKWAPPRLSIVVLPFANIGGDPQQEDFVDGVTESLTTDLSRIAGAIVIGRNTAFTFKRKEIDLRRVGRELNVRYVLEGSVQRGGGRMRVNVQLIEAETGAHLWAERFDKPLADLFDMQDEIVSRLASALKAQLVAAEARRAERSPSPDSMDLYFQGRACAHRAPSPCHLAQARDFFERALALDQANIEALVGRAYVDVATASVLMPEDRNARLAASEAALTKALSLVPDHAFAHLVLGILKIHSNRASDGIGECEQALALDRNLAAAHGFIGLAKTFVGRAEEAEAQIEEALRLSPRDVLAHVWVAFSGMAKAYLEQHEEAVERLQRSIKINNSFSLAHFYCAAELAHLGRMAEAHSAVQAGLAVDPGFTISRFRAGAPSDNPIFRAQHERVLHRMRKAGVPEG